MTLFQDWRISNDMRWGKILQSFSNKTCIVPKYSECLRYDRKRKRIYWIKTEKKWFQFVSKNHDILPRAFFEKKVMKVGLKSKRLDLGPTSFRTGTMGLRFLQEYRDELQRELQRLVNVFSFGFYLPSNWFLSFFFSPFFTVVFKYKYLESSPRLACLAVTAVINCRISIEMNIFSCFSLFIRWTISCHLCSVTWLSWKEPSTDVVIPFCIFLKSVRFQLVGWWQMLLFGEKRSTIFSKTIQ